MIQFVAATEKPTEIHVKLIVQASQNILVELVSENMTIRKSSIILIFFLIIFVAFSCNKIDSECIESIDPACACTKQYNPVCGCNGITYGNSCMAECSGITDYVEGECL